MFQTTIAAVNPAVYESLCTEKLTSSLAERRVADLNIVLLPPCPFPFHKINAARYYEQHCGRVGPHRDVARDGVSTHTLIFYLCDCDGDLVFETGERITPRKDLAVLFPKSEVHWVEEFSGLRRLIVCDASFHL